MNASSVPAASAHMSPHSKPRPNPMTCCRHSIMMPAASDDTAQIAAVLRLGMCHTRVLRPASNHSTRDRNPNMIACTILSAPAKSWKDSSGVGSGANVSHKMNSRVSVDGIHCGHHRSRDVNKLNNFTLQNYCFCMGIAKFAIQIIAQFNNICQ